MLAKRIIPCLDVTAGRVVKGVNCVDLRDAGDPVELAALYSDAGADELVFLDITASSDARATMLDVIERTTQIVSDTWRAPSFSNSDASSTWGRIRKLERPRRFKRRHGSNSSACHTIASGAQSCLSFRNLQGVGL